MKMYRRNFRASSYIGAAKIKDGLFLCDDLSIRDAEFLSLIKVGRILNCAGKQVQNRNSKFIKYLSLPWVESDKQILFDDQGKTLLSIVEFLREAESSGEGVIIHSVKGVNRCACALLAYFMSEYKWPLGKALEFIQSRRPGLKIMHSFMLQLQELDQKLRGNQQNPQLDSWSDISYANENEEITKNTFLNSKTTVTVQQTLKRKIFNLNQIKRDNIKLRWLDHTPGGKLATYLGIPLIRKNFKISTCNFNSPVKSQTKNGFTSPAVTAAVVKDKLELTKQPTSQESDSSNQKPQKTSFSSIIKGSGKLFDRQTGGELNNLTNQIKENPNLNQLIEEDAQKKYLPPLCESFVASDFDENINLAFSGSSPVQLGQKNPSVFKGFELISSQNDDLLANSDNTKDSSNPQLDYVDSFSQIQDNQKNLNLVSSPVISINSSQQTQIIQLSQLQSNKYDSQDKVIDKSLQGNLELKIIQSQEIKEGEISPEKQIQISAQIPSITLNVSPNSMNLPKEPIIQQPIPQIDSSVIATPPFEPNNTKLMLSPGKPKQKIMFLQKVTNNLASPNISANYEEPETYKSAFPSRISTIRSFEPQKPQVGIPRVRPNSMDQQRKKYSRSKNNMLSSLISTTTSNLIAQNTRRTPELPKNIFEMGQKVMPKNIRVLSQNNVNPQTTIIGGLNQQQNRRKDK